MRKISHLFPVIRLRPALAFSLLTLILAACQPGPTPTPDAQQIDALMTQAVQTALAEIETSTPLPTDTPLPTVTQAARTPPALPPDFTTEFLNPMDSPHAYEADTCTYLKNKWDPNKSAPGTIVMVVMLHGIKKKRSGCDCQRYVGHRFPQDDE